MSVEITIIRAGALASVQDSGRSGVLNYGVSASGPMDRGAFARAGAVLRQAGRAGIEFTTGGLAFAVSEPCRAGFAGGNFELRVNDSVLDWPGMAALAGGDRVEIVPGAWGNYGYMRFERELSLAPVLGSLATNSRIGIGGLAGRTLQAGDRIGLGAAGGTVQAASDCSATGAIRVVWGAHADLFEGTVRKRFVSEVLQVSSRMDRMGVRLNDGGAIFAGAGHLSLVSEPIVAGDIQILGDGTPIVLMRDHQPTGGYPRIATVISADFDRFAQVRPGLAVRFAPVTVLQAQAVLRRGGSV